MLEFLKKRWVYHSLLWCLFFVFMVLVAKNSSTNETLTNIVLVILAFVSVIILVTYSSFYVKQRFFDNRAYFIYFVLILGIIFSSAALLQWAARFYQSFPGSFTQNIVNFTSIVLFANGLQYFKRGIVNQYQLQELRAQNAEIQLTALKSQLNPHFLFNTLNNIYAINQIDSQKGTEMIMELSEVMRYHLGFSKMKKVTLEDEIQLIKSYIALELLRLNDSFELKTDIEQPQPSLKIAPLLLLTFIENAFKHGTHPVQPSFVHLDLKTESKTLYFKLTNSIIANKKSVSTLIGLENTQKRLQLIYPKKHQLTIDKNDTTYSVNLTIQL